MELNWYGRFDYNEKKVKEEVTNKGGNYMISARLQNGKNRPIYVGKARYLEKRLLEHLSNGEENKCIKDSVRDNILYFRYCYVNNERDRKNIEYTLYKRYTPKCNKDVPEGNEIKINFPY